MSKRTHRPRTAPAAQPGDRFGQLEVIGEGVSGASGMFYPCMCHSCGNPTMIRWALRDSSKTCGCGQGRRSHGGRRTRLYSIWSNMYDRCLREKNPAYHRYGGRGVKVCAEWRDFAAFRDWAGSSGYEDRLTLDRIDNDGDYAPENCRWVSMKDQSRNRRNNLLFSWDGETKTLIEWVEDQRCVVSYMTAYNRIKRGDWDLERAITTPVKERPVVLSK